MSAVRTCSDLKATDVQVVSPDIWAFNFLSDVLYQSHVHACMCVVFGQVVASGDLYSVHWPVAHWWSARESVLFSGYRGGGEWQLAEPLCGG